MNPSPFKCALCTSTSAMHQRQSREYVVYVENIICTLHSSCLDTSLLLIPRTPPRSSVLRYSSVLVRLMPQYFTIPQSSYASSFLSTSLCLSPRTPHASVLRCSRFSSVLHSKLAQQGAWYAYIGPQFHLIQIPRT